MIGFLNGVLIEKTPDSVILDVAGVGYELTVPASSFCAMPRLGEASLLYVHTHVREDAIRLFGFATLFDRKVFESLISVSNVGPKLALSLLAPLDGEALCEVIVQGRLALLCNIPGVGQKTAERLILELKPKLTKLLQSRDIYSTKTASEHSRSKAGKSGAEAKTDGHLFDSWEDAEGNGGGTPSGRDRTNGANGAGALGAGDLASGGEGYVVGGLSKNQRAERDLRLKREAIAQRHQSIEDLKSALLNIGYKEKQIIAALQTLHLQTEQGILEPIAFETEFRKVLRTLSGHLIKETEAN